MARKKGAKLRSINLINLYKENQSGKDVPKKSAFEYGEIKLLHMFVW